MNVCDFNQKQIDDLGKLIKKALHDKRMHGKQASDERLYLKVEDRRRGLKSMKDVQVDEMWELPATWRIKTAPESKQHGR